MQIYSIDRSLSWLVVINPAAANGRLARQEALWQARLRSVLPKAGFISTRPDGGLVGAIKDAQAAGLGGVVAVGGDGTMHLVVNAIMQVKKETKAEILFALLPVGTGNDWVRTHGIPRQWNAWKAMFLAGKVRQQHLGLLKYRAPNGEVAQRYFVNVAGLAYDAFVVRELAQQSGRSGGRLRYLWATFACLFRYTPQAARLTWPTASASEVCYTINVGIGRYSGGGMQLVPHAEPEGEGLALTYVTSISKLRVLLNSWRFYRGWVAGLREANLKTVSALKIESTGASPILLEADGEFLGETPVEVTFIPKGLHFVGT